MNTMLSLQRLALPLTFAQLGGFLVNRVLDAYVGVGSAAVDAFNWMVSQCSRT